MQVEAHLRGFEPPAWAKAKAYLETADFARKVVVQYVVLPNYDERIRFAAIRNDGRPSLLAGMSIEQFNDATPSQIIGMIEAVADTYHRGFAEPISEEQKQELGATLQSAWRQNAPILFSIWPTGQNKLHVIDVIEHLSLLLEGQIGDEKVAEYLKFAGLGEIREDVRKFFPDDYYTVTDG